MSIEDDPSCYGFRGLIRACEIFLMFAPGKLHPTHCEHDVLYVDVDPKDVPPEFQEILEKLGFEPGYEGDGTDSGFISYRYGSC